MHPKGPLPMLSPRRSWERGAGGHSQDGGGHPSAKGTSGAIGREAPEEGPKLQLKEPHVEDPIGCYGLSAPALG